ncbi:PIF1 helicase [Striga hermonthica]|uniref:ATP-dependent DNA helicase n=1 Tax=Striga hermonthica TaxID=68872 RepID=A0A9N7R558_STRHE|nr:PIF1 helicase [Striga hermonthica]
MSSGAPVTFQAVAVREGARLAALQRWRGRKKAQSCPGAVAGTSQPVSRLSPIVGSHKRAREVALRRLGNKRARSSCSGHNSACASSGVRVSQNRASNADDRTVPGSQAMRREAGAVQRGATVRSGSVVRPPAGANDGRHLLDNVPAAAYTLRVQRDCRYCGARKIVYETIKCCCSEGAIRLASAPLRAILKDLLLSNTSEAKFFRTCIRTINNQFAFTSLGVMYDKELSQRNNGVYTFRIQGQMYHFLNDLESSNNLQLYFHDTENEVSNRIIACPRLTENITVKVLKVLEGNPYARFFRGLSTVQNLSDCRIILRSVPGLDQRTYNQPTESEVAALWVDGSGSEEPCKRDIRVSCAGGASHRIQYYFGCYDPLQYPLMFPFGQVGWHQGIEKKNWTGAQSSGGHCRAVSFVSPWAAVDAEDIKHREEDEKKKGAFFVDGPGGTGKSFLYRALLATVQSRGCIALATATSGIVASMLPRCRTAHSRFKIPIDLSDMKFCTISKQSCLGSLIRESKLIVWDEAPMAKKDAIEALNLALKDLCGCDELFGGKVVVFGGDFRQVLPVLRRATRDETVGACLSSSYIWPLLTKLHLVENMRARLDPSFTEMLLRIGNGQECTYDEDLVKIPPSIAISEPLADDSLDELIRIIYPDLAHLTETELSVNRAILTTKNSFVDEVNAKLINEFPGDLVEYLSFEKVENPAHEAEYGDLINSLTPSGIPKHRLMLKKMHRLYYCRIWTLRKAFAMEQDWCAKNWIRMSSTLRFRLETLRARVFSSTEYRLNLYQKNNISFPTSASSFQSACVLQ